MHLLRQVFELFPLRVCICTHHGRFIDGVEADDVHLDVDLKWRPWL